MNRPTISTPRNLIKSVFSLAILLLIALHTTAIRADSTDGSTPLALKPGAPAGSYALSDLDHINPYNGSLNFRLPLLNISGRGTAGFTMSLPIERKWRINDLATYLMFTKTAGTDRFPSHMLHIIISLQAIGGLVSSRDMDQVYYRAEWANSIRKCARTARCARRLHSRD